MSGIRALRQIQYGGETTPGTAAAATSLWRGVGLLHDEGQPVGVDEDLGQLQPSERSMIPTKGATIAIDATPFTFEQGPILLACGVENVITGVADGTGSGKIYQYDLPPSATPNAALKSYTVRAGDDTRVDVVEYCQMEEFTITGAAREAVTIEGTWRGRQATDGDFTTTPAPAVPTVEAAMFGNCLVKLDTSGGTIGTTNISSSVLGFKLTAPTGWKFPFTASGGNTFATPIYVGNVKNPWMLELTLEHDAVGEAEIVAARAGNTQRLIRIVCNGSALTTPGTTYTYKTLQIDVVGTPLSVPDLQDVDGDDVITMQYRIGSNAAKTLAAQIIVVNQVTALS
jgi:hypothetical protein